ncbi:rhomboid family intramembrane serine protease [Enterococcus faecium]|uniref:rhomboid family intramembrane serine protease n=1 Tax=Enterococcus faecium TaxID=1352 RepID=UPI0022360A11|nr:rhomboid family intramembrane serine protease [Enterococcus faecium]
MATVVFVCVLIFLFDFLQVGKSIIGNTLSAKEMVALGGLYEGHLFPNIFISIVSHINLYHLISNLLFLVVLEEALNDQYEWLTLLIVLIISGFLGSLVPFLLHSNIVSMGLSGGIFGWIALFAIAYIRFDSKKHLLLSVFVLLIVGILLVSTFESGETNVLSHVIGFVCGMILGFILKNVSLIKQKN